MPHNALSRKSAVTRVLAGLAVGALVAAFLALGPLSGDWKQDRADYQASLDRSNDAFSPVFHVVRKGGLLYLRSDYEPRFCDRQCGIVTLKEDGYEVKLPVGYTWGSNVTPFPERIAPIHTLVFWDPQEHQVRTIEAPADDETVRLPEVLIDRDAKEVREGETVYTSPDFIRQTANGVEVYGEAPVSYERLGREFGYVLTAQLKRTENSFKVCLTTDYGPFIKDPDMDGIPASILPAGCAN